MPESSLSPALFSIFTTLIEERVGLTYGQADKTIFESKLGPQAEEAGFESLLDYYYHLRYDDPDGAGFQTLVQALVVHETFFFREFGPLRAAVEAIVLPLVAEGHRPRVWCAACSTGEEPLSLAMLLAELNILSKVELVASDISTRALSRAKSGNFGPRALRQPAPPALAHYLTQTATGFRVAPELVAAIDWRRLNLIDSAAIQTLGTMDLILCRNVLIYFRDETASRVVSLLTSQLAARGSLLVGLSESLTRFNTTLSCEQHADAFLYRKVMR